MPAVCACIGFGTGEGWQFGILLSMANDPAGIISFWDHGVQLRGRCSVCSVVFVSRTFLGDVGVQVHVCVVHPFHHSMWEVLGHARLVVVAATHVHHHQQSGCDIRPRIRGTQVEMRPTCLVDNWLLPRGFIMETLALG